MKSINLTSPFFSYLFLVVFFLINSTEATAINNPKGYFRKTNKAEIAICQKHYKKASRIYSRILKRHGGLFYRDAHNLALCDIQIRKDTAVIFSDMKRLFDLGMRLDTTDSSNYFWAKNDYSTTIQNWVRAKRLNQPPLSAGDSLINTLMLLDQSVRVICGNEYNLPTYDDMCIDTIQTIDSLNQERLIAYFKTSQIGVPLDLNSRSLMKLSILIQHSMQWQKTPLLPTLHEMVLEGSFDARMYANIVDRAAGYEYSLTDPEIGLVGKYGRYIGSMKGDMYFICLDTSANFYYDNHKLVENRRAIFLEDIVLAHYKIAYLRQCSNLPFQFDIMDWYRDIQSGIEYAEIVETKHLPVQIIRKGACDELNFKRFKKRRLHL